MRKSGIILLLVSLALFGSCQSDSFEPIEYKYFEGVLFERKVDFQTMIDDVMHHYGENAGDFGELDGLLQKGRLLAKDYTVYGIKYKTVDHEGKPVSASGLIYFPESFRKKGTLEMIPVNKSRVNCGTANRSIPEAIAGCTGYIMIVPDLLGCGESSDYAICYMQHDLIVRVAADMRKAAYEFLYNQRRFRLGRYDYLFGYSLGGSGVLALARYYAEHPEEGVKVKELWLGAGAYFPRQMVDMFVKTRQSSYAILPNILYSLEWYENLGLDFNEVFTGDLRDNYEELVTGDVSTDYLSSRLGSSLDAYISPDFMSEDCEGWRKVQESLSAKDIPIDFKPDFPVYLYHSVDDTVIPHDLSDSLNARLLRAGAKVNYVQTEGTHHNTGFKIEGDLALHLAL